MGVRRWIYRLLSRGEPPELDPAEIVELEIVSQPRAALLVAGLEREGIAVYPQDWANAGAIHCSEVRLMVRRDQWVAAAEELDRLRK